MNIVKKIRWAIYQFSPVGSRSEWQKFLDDINRWWGGPPACGGMAVVR